MVRGLLGLARLAVLVGRRFRGDLCLERSASLAFATTIAAIPSSMLLLLSLQIVYVQNSREPIERFYDLVTRTVPDTSRVEASGGATVAPDPGPSPRDKVRAALLQLEEELQLSRRLQESVSLSSAERTTAAALAVLVLLFCAMTLFRSAERSFTGIWRVEKGRSTFEKLATFWLLLTAAPLILAASLYVKSALGATIQGSLGSESGWATLVQIIVLDALFPVSISFFAFLLLLMYLPHTRVRLSAAAAGALFAAVGWELGTRAFHWYVENTLLSGVLGALGVVPFSLLWVYFSWILVLLGAEISYCTQHYPVLVREAWGREPERTLSRPTLALIVLDQVYRGFRGLEPRPGLDSLADRAGVPLSEVEEVIGRLVDSGFLNESPDGAYLPTREAGRVKPLDVLRIFPLRDGFQLSPAAVESGHPLARLLGEVSGEIESRLGRATMADLLPPEDRPA